jgi:hypothetical protein
MSGTEGEQRSLAIGLIQKLELGQLFLLLNWNQKQQRWKFVCGQRIENESYRETITREIAWQLDLDRQKDFIVANVPQLSVETIEQLPGEDREISISVEFYCIHLYGRTSGEKVDRTSNLSWFSCAEICQGFTHQGETIDPTIVAWLNKWQVVQPWR